ncbi:polysaccharide biosynthesis C-terminal domain-containing protein [Streptomyces sp. 5-8]|uniref:Probable multidrug resistance protein NorM n=1 Tax=Streptomyces musisoli TaxID=2802280 RepID=A0ABS1P0Y4_9ACTN|nr:MULTISPECIES: MATE family efflux transporter [Streptomyces]MBL1106032.1 polysaccharide biosynthesis C-terminal domain-containing protein [Streptomyces musisoli]MBY8844143.1 polysaccharide biosynthesis C-terminal domain-containing protein [Streptomyces sp. SP2-10]
MNAHRGQLVSLARPVYFSLLASVASGIINTVWVSRCGGAAVAAVAVATNTENVLLGVALVFASGTTVLVAHARGARDPAAVRAAVRGGRALCAVVTPVVAVGGFLLREPLAALVLGGGDEGARRLAAAYFAISLPGMAVFFAQQLVDGILKGIGDTRTPMRLALLANGLILLCDPFLIHRCGVQGAALSTVLCRGVALAVGLRVLGRRAPLRAAAGTRPAEGVRTALRRTLATGLPMSADFTVRQGSALVLVAIVARLGVTAVAGYSIAYKVLYVATMAFYSVRQAAAIHTAHTRGAGLDARRDIGRQAVLLSGTLGLLSAVLFAAAAPWITAAFGAGPEVAGQGVLFLRCIGPYLLLMACFIALGGVFEGGGEAPALLRVTLLGTVVQLPLAYGLTGLGLPGVCLALALAMAVQCAAAVAVLPRRARRQEETGVSSARVA